MNQDKLSWFLLAYTFLISGIATAFTDYESNDEAEFSVNVIGAGQSSSNAVPRQFPWHVYLRSRLGNNVRICGGAIIAENKVLTAAHCFNASEYNLKDFSTWEVRAGALKWDTNTAQTARITDVVHPGQYKHDNLGKDIAVVTLTARLTLSPGTNVDKIRLPDSTYTPTGLCNFAGWGTTSFAAGNSATNLKRVTFRIADHEQCKIAWRSNPDPETIDDEMLCVNSTNKATGKGDSGGALVCKESNVKYVAGIASFADDEKTCDVYPSVFTNVVKFVTWINQELTATPTTTTTASPSVR